MGKKNRWLTKKRHNFPQLPWNLSLPNLKDKGTFFGLKVFKINKLEYKLKHRDYKIMLICAKILLIVTEMFYLIILINSWTLCYISILYKLCFNLEDYKKSIS